MCKAFSDFQKKILTAIKYKSEIDNYTESTLAEIDKETKSYLEKSTQHSEKDKARLEKISQKLELSLEEKNENDIDTNLAEMLSLLDEDHEQTISNEISDEKLKNVTPDD